MSAITFTMDDPKIKVLDWMLNLTGYTPIVSSFSGECRKVYGIARLIFGIASIIFSTQAIAAQLVISGLYHLARGYIEVIPFIGNGICIFFDILRLISSC